MSGTSEIAEPDLIPLHRALAKCGIGANQIPHVAKQLSRPPLSFGLSAAADPEPGATIQLGAGQQGKLAKEKRAFDGDIAARMLRLDEGQPTPDAKWKTLSRAERKRAKRLWDWTGKAHGLSSTPQGRPPVIDAALVLYCTRVLCEASGRPFKFSRVAGALGGPMWRALTEALPLAKLFLQRRYGPPATSRISAKEPNIRNIRDHAETIAEIVRVIRSKPFKDLCQTHNLGPSSDDVAANAAMFRLVIAYARSRTHESDGSR